MSSLCLFSRRTLIIVAVFALSGVCMFSSLVSSSASTQYSVLLPSQQKPNPELSPTAQSPGQQPTQTQSGQGASANQGNSNARQQGATSAAGSGGTNNQTDNGITVGKPKQFDERTLTAMLQDLQNKLSRSQFPDPSALYSSTGRFAGATATTTSMGISVRGPSTPSVETTIGASTKATSGSKTVEGGEETVTIGGTNPSTTNKATSSNEATTSGETANTSQQITKQGSFAPPIPAQPSQTSMFSFQLPFGLSAQDLLSEQTSLFYQIVNLRLLLDRSITDRIWTKSEGNTSIPGKRDQLVLGFQISIDAAYKDAVAEAEITIHGTDVSLVSLMPQDKTYNVASITKDAKAIDMGAVVQFVGVGANIGKTQESLYLVKDTDTVALERPASHGEAKFAWQFRPVLGRRTVEPGSRQVFALLSIPQGGDRNLKVTAVTKWRRYDRKTKTVGALINGGNAPQYEENVKVGHPYYTAYSLKPVIARMSWSDMGNGQVLVVVEGDGFTSDTALVAGNNVLSGPEKGLTVANEKRLIVVTQGQLLAQSPSPPMLIGRYGTSEFVRGQCIYDSTRSSQPDPKHPCGDTSFEVINKPYKDLDLQPPTIRARDAQTSEVTVKLVAKKDGLSIEDLFEKHSPVVVIGGKVFGLSDAPFIAKNFKATRGERAWVELTFVAPAQLLFDSKKLIVKEFLWNDGELEADISIPNSFGATAVVTLGSNGDRTQLAIAGRGFKKKEVRVQVGETLFAADCTGESKCVQGLTLNTDDGTATVITLSPTKAEIKDVKQILVKQGKAQPISLPLTLSAPATPTAKINAPTEPINLKEGDSIAVKFQGVNFESIQKVVFEGKELSSKPDPDDKTVRWVEVSTVVTGKKGMKRIAFVMKDDKEVPFHIVVN